ncbi:Pvc16 family protein [Variovorax saccharolyticus]|uniref:Pvc16 family protein n=1 Tax=Variovorax saccharolyticus TaxID=3053516 RepID=UPI00257707DD|nr:Pvc16 family protein [Variovorax sp. J31P216]MDM0030049.1 Pvc16 family protein [Variovorax sp. J31P216]
MAVGPSSLSAVCRQFGQVLSSGINDIPDNSRIEVLVGTPAAAATAGGEGDADHRLNLFFFRFEPSGFFPDTLPGETWLLRMHCLITPFCADDDTISAGENDLRVIGEVLRMLHERPVQLMTVDGEQFEVQSVFCTLGLDQLNQLWSTQGDTIYRPSALFEVSLAPVIPREAAVPAPLVGSLGLGVRATLAARHGLPLPAQIATHIPLVRRLAPDTRVDEWVPALCLVDDDACLRSVALPLDELAGFAPRAWVAGAPGAEVSLRWQVWSAAEGWLPAGAPDTFAVVDMAIDPDAVDNATTRPLELPFNDRSGQMLLTAQREVVRGSDGVAITLRSEPVLITVFEGP